MLRFLLFSTFTILFFIGCNSERAELRRIEAVNPLMFQFGAWSRLTPEANLSEDRCLSVHYSKRDESYYCAGTTLSFIGEEHGGNLNTKTDAVLVKFDRRFRVSWIRQLGLRTQGSHSEFDDFRSITEDSTGNIFVSLKTSSVFKIQKYSPNGVLIDEVITEACHKIKVFNNSLICAGRKNDNAYVAKYSLDLRKDWEKSILEISDGGLANDISGSQQCLGLDISRSGKIACAGRTSSSLESGHAPAPGKDDGFLWLLSFEGVPLDLKQIGTDTFFETIKNVIFDRNENIILQGNYIDSDGTLIPRVVSTGFENTFLYRLNFVENAYVPDSYVPNTALSYETRTESMTLTSNGSLAVCGQTKGFLSVEEANAEAGNTNLDVIIFLYDANTWTFKKAKQFGSLTKGRFDNKGHQFCNSITHDQLGNFILAGETTGSTQEPNAGGNAGTRDIMIWRVGPNFEF